MLLVNLENYHVEPHVKLVKPTKPNNMSTCLNCKTKLGCGCQKRVASDGKSVCATCLGKYEQSLKTLEQAAPANGSAPNNVNVFYKAP